LAVRNLPEEQEIRDKFRELRNKLKKQFEDFDEAVLKLDEVDSAIKYQYNIIARLEEEFEKIPKDEDLILELDSVEFEKEEKVNYAHVPERTYTKLLNRLERLEAKLSRVSMLDMLGKNARLLTQNITAKADIEEKKASTKRIELTTHQASLLALSKMFYLALRKLGYADIDIVNVAKELKRLEKDYPIIETDYDSMRKMLYAQPEEMPNVIDADFEEVEGDPLATLDNIISGKKPKRGNK
jgi:hypothetical protein